MRVVAASTAGTLEGAHPLRGSVLHMADDFDVPLDELWSSLDA